MASPSEWVPVRWLCGPLDISQRQEKKNFTSRSKEILQRWLDPSLLEMLRGTPVNCVVVNWAAGVPADAEQQKALAPLLSRGKTAGLSLVGIVDGEANRAAALASARAAGLDVVMASGETAGAGLPVVTLADRPQLPWGSPSPVLAAKGSVWPGVAAPGLPEQGWRTGADATAAGPTAEPWIDSNGWFVRLAKSYAPSKKIWLVFEPPQGPNVTRVDAYQRAIADTYTCGGRWVLTLDESLRAGLAGKEQAALDSWKTITGTLAFFEGRRKWLEFRPRGVIGVVSDFSGPNETTGAETLNLIARRSLPFQIIQASKAAETPFTGLKALICVDEALPAPALRKKLVSFAEQGGALLVSQSWKGEGGASTGREHPRLDLRTLGKGKMAVCKSESPDPYMVARDIHVLAGRASDLVRFYNLTAFVADYSAAPDGSSALLQLTCYAARGAGDVATVWFPDPYRSARLWEVGAANPKPLSMFPENTGMDVELPILTTYLGVELSKGKLG